MDRIAPRRPPGGRAREDGADPTGIHSHALRRTTREETRMYIVAANLVVDPKDAATFAERIKQHARNSLGKEGGLGFSVSRDHYNPASFHIGAVEKNAAAYDDHTAADVKTDSTKLARTLKNNTAV